MKATLWPQEGENYSSCEQLLKQREGWMEGRKEGGWPEEKQNTAELQRSCQPGMNSVRLSILSQSEKDCLGQHSPLTDVLFSFLMNDS